MIRILFFAWSMISVSNAWGQATGINEELKKVFFGLPVDTTLTVLIDAAKANTVIKYIDLKNDDYTGYLPDYKYLKLQPKHCVLQIFTSGGYSIAGQMLDSVLIISMDANYGDILTKDIKKQYKELITTFKKISMKTEKFELYSGSGKAGDGFYFFRTKEEKIPYLTIVLSSMLTISFDEDDGMRHAIHINYNRVNRWH